MDHKVRFFLPSHTSHSKHFRIARSRALESLKELPLITIPHSSSSQTRSPCRIHWVLPLRALERSPSGQLAIMSLTDYATISLLEARACLSVKFNRTSNPRRKRHSSSPRNAHCQSPISSHFSMAIPNQSTTTKKTSRKTLNPSICQLHTFQLPTSKRVWQRGTRLFSEIRSSRP